MTTRTESTLSANFAENVGANDQVAFAGALYLSGTRFPTMSPRPWFGFELQTPYYFNPSEGNLLMDIRNFGGGTTTALDAANVVADGVASVYAFGVSGAGAETGTARTLGLAMLISVQPVPEPSTYLLVGLGGVPLFIFWRRQKRKDLKPRTGTHEPV